MPCKNSSGALLCVLLTATGGAHAAPPVGLSPSKQQTVFLRDLELDSNELLAKTRRECALNLASEIKREVEAVQPGTVFPPLDTYCLKAISVSARRGVLPDLYIKLALQEQGHSEFAFASDAALLSHDEAGQTTGRILRAAKAGATVYASISGATRPLPCPLAIDAGYSWAYQYPDRRLSGEPTLAKAMDIAHACYVPSSREIAGMFAQQAGLYAGAVLGREARRGASP